MTAVTISVSDQIKKALDGRTQRWLSLNVAIPEQELSKKMKGIIPFKEDELKKIESRLNFKIED